MLNRHSPISFLGTAGVLALALAALLPDASASPNPAPTPTPAYRISLPIVLQGTEPVRGPVLKWQNGGCRTTWCRTGWYASPAVADLDGDGRPEGIWTDYRILAVTGHGDGYVAIHTAQGAPYAGWPKQPTPGNELRSLAVADVEGDGDLEILICSTRSDNQWFLYDHNGSLRSGWPVHSPDSDSNGYSAGCFNENLGLADLDGDGRVEIIGPNDTHYVVGYNDDATPLRASPIYGQIGGQNKPWARVGFHLDHAVDLRGSANCAHGQPPLEHRPNFADSAPTLVDVNGDGVREIIIIGNQYDCRTSPYTSLYQLPYILRVDRTRWSGNGFNWTALPIPDGASGPLSEDYNRIETVQPNPVVVDLDGDGLAEILYASYDGRMHAYWLDKTEHGAWPYPVTDPGEGLIRFASEPAVADLNRDGKAEVILTTWTEKGRNAGGQLLVLDWQGNLLYALNLPRASGQSWDGALPAPTIANLDADADFELVIGTAHTGLVAYDLPGSAGARILWGSGRGGYLRAGHP